MKQKNAGNKTAIMAMISLAMLVGLVGGAMKFSRTNAQNANLTAITTAENGNQQAQLKNQNDSSKGGHVGANGTREVLLEDGDAEKAKAAALQAVPGGTVLRVETDAEGAVYEAHMTKPDGTPVTVKFDGSFKVTAVETGIQKKNKIM